MPTRGYGLLETFLSRQRSQKANALLFDSFRQGRLLDIGCGDFLFLGETVFQEKYALDKRAPHVADLNLRYVRHDFEQGLALPFLDDCFEVVTLLAVVEHLDMHRGLLLFQEIRRILKSGGICIATTPSSWTNPLLRVMAALGLLSSVEINEHKTLYSKKRFRQLLTRAGFAEDRIELGRFEGFCNLWARVHK